MAVVTAIGSRLFVHGERSVWWIRLPVEIGGEQIMCPVRMYSFGGGKYEPFGHRDDARNMRDRLQHILATGGTIYAVREDGECLAIEASEYGVTFPEVKGFTLHRKVIRDARCTRNVRGGVA
jgi:hypothetical protein